MVGACISHPPMGSDTFRDLTGKKVLSGIGQQWAKLGFYQARKGLVFLVDFLASGNTGDHLTSEQ